MELLNEQLNCNDHNILGLRERMNFLIFDFSVLVIIEIYFDLQEARNFADENSVSLVVEH